MLRHFRFAESIWTRQSLAPSLTMLTTLRIKNLALVPDLTVEFGPGYNAITGETGAGKSILIGALTLVLGERADRSLIRTGTDACSVEAVFEIGKLRKKIGQFLDASGVDACEGDQLVLKRTFTVAGSNRQFVNGSPTSLSTLAKVGEWLVDIHGPHEHQSLLQPARQLDILDAFGRLQPAVDRFSDLAQQRRKLDEEKAALVLDERTFIQQLELLRFQVNEIKAAKLVPDEEPQLENEFRRASNAAELLRLCQTVLGALSEEDNSVLHQIGTIGRLLQDIAKLDPDTSGLRDAHEQTLGQLQELQRQIGIYADRLELDPLRYQELEERLNLIQSLKRKYGSTLAEVIEFGKNAAQRMSALDQRDAELIRINHAVEKIQAQLAVLGADLSAQRRKVAPRLNKAVARQLADLGFKQCQFEVVLKTDPKPDLDAPSQNGFDQIEFQFAPNPGEAPRPLRAIASSGELARVMLALKTVLAAEDEVPVLIFDEVDANVGGETAHAVGDKMRQIGAQRQVLCITHLAPVAAAAQTHFVVSKETVEGRTISQLMRLDHPRRVSELARMLGGQSEAARHHAEELLAPKS